MNDPNPEQPPNKLPYVGDHKHVCCFYRSHKEMERLWVPFIAEGLSQGHKCFVIVGEDYGTEDAIHALASTRVDIDQDTHFGSLVVVNSAGFPTSSDATASEIVGFWESHLTPAYEEGYKSVRVAAQMTWLSAVQRESDVVPEYEFLCNKLFPKLAMSALCMYDTNIFSQHQLERVAAAHPYVTNSATADSAPLGSSTAFLVKKVLQSSSHNQDARNCLDYEKATRLLADGDFLESEKLYRLVVESQTGLTKVSAMLGLIQALRGQGRTAEADKLEDRATELLLKR